MFNAVFKNKGGHAKYELCAMLELFLPCMLYLHVCFIHCTHFHSKTYKGGSRLLHTAAFKYAASNTHIKQIYSVPAHCTAIFKQCEMANMHALKRVCII